MYSYELKKPRTALKVFITIIVTAVIMFFLMQYLYENSSKDEKITGQKLSAESDEQDEITKSKNRIEIIENIMPSVVGVSILKPSGMSIIDINSAEKWGIGTGIVVSEKGYILTNQHLVQNINSRVTVTLENGESVLGKVVWSEENIDLAIIKVDYKNLTVASLGDSDGLKIGEDVLAIGNPLGLEFQRSVTRGIVSGLNRTLKLEEDDETYFMEDLIQTDASINPGNSGGPLINLDGEVIGVNTVKVTSAEGIGFAVPINIVKVIVEKLEETDKFEESSIGIFAYDREIAQYMNLSKQLDRGIYVVSIDKGGASENSGLRVGDIITKIDNMKIDKMVEVRKYIYQKEPGDEVKLTILSGNKEKEISVKLGKK